LDTDRTIQTYTFLQKNQLIIKFIDMKKIIIIIIFITINSLYAQTTWINTNPISYKIKSVKFINPNTGWIVTSDQGVYKTTDKGQSFFLQFTKGTFFLLCQMLITCLQQADLTLQSKTDYLRILK